MEHTSPPTVSRKTRKGYQKASKASKAYNSGKPKIKKSTNEYFSDGIPPNKRKTRRGQAADSSDNFSMRISKRNIPRSSRVLRSATHGVEILSESQSCPHPCLADLQDTDPLHFEFGGDISSSEETEHSKVSNRLLIKRVGSEHISINAGTPKGCYIKCDPNFNDLSMKNNNLTTQPNNNITADGQQRESCNELVSEPCQRAVIADEGIYRTDNLTYASKAKNPETRSQNDATQECDFDYLLSDGSTFFEDYRWLLGFDTNDLAPELPEVSIDDIATLPNLDLGESVPLTEIRPTLFQSVTYEIGSDLAAGLWSYQWDGCSQVSDSVATRTAAQPIIPQHEPMCVSTSAISSTLYVNTNLQTVTQSQWFDTTIENSGELGYSATSGGNIEPISSPVETRGSSILDNNPDSPYIKQELDFEPQCRIHLVDTPPSFTRITEPDANPIRHQVFERQNSVHSNERPTRNLRNWQQQSVERHQWTSAAEPNELQNLVHSVGPQIRTFQDRQPESSARPQRKSGAQVNERQNSVHSDGPPMNKRQDVIHSQHYQADVTFQSRQQQSFTSGAQPNEPQDAIHSLSSQAEAFRREQPLVLTPLPPTTTHRPQTNKRQRSAHPAEPPTRIFQRRQESVKRPQSKSGAQANELQSSVHSRKPPGRSFPNGTQWSTGAQEREQQVSVHAEGPQIRTFRNRQQESFSRPQGTSGAQPNERQNSVHLDESPMTTFQGRQQQMLARPQRTNRPQVNDTFQRDQSSMRTPLPCTTTYNPQANERQSLVHSGSPVCRIYPRPFARMPSTVATPTTTRVIERQNWHHSYQPQHETHYSYSWQENPSSSTMAPLRDVFEAGQNLTSSKQYQQSQQTLAQMEASEHYISNQQYGQHENCNSYTRSEVSSMMSMFAEHGQNSFSPMLPSHSLPDNYAYTPQGSVDHSSVDQRAQFGSWRDSLNVLSKNC